jgi:hypothetical protein
MRRAKWNWQTATRTAAGLLLVDQMLGPISGLPKSEGVVIFALSLLFAPKASQRKS